MNVPGITVWEGIYLGLAAQETQTKLNTDPAVLTQELKFNFETCQRFYIETVTKIKNRFSFQDTIF